MRLWLIRLLLPPDYLLFQRDNYEQVLQPLRLTHDNIPQVREVLAEMERYLLDGGYGHHSRMKVAAWLGRLHRILSEVQ